MKNKKLKKKLSPKEEIDRLSNLTGLVVLLVGLVMYIFIVIDLT